MIVIGVDPGTATTGYGVIRTFKKKKGFKALCYDCIKTSPSLSDAERLKRINNELSKIISRYQPEILAVENIFFFKNAKTVIPVSQAKGVIMMTAAKKKLPVYEFSPLQVKLIVAGHGWAEKKKMQEEIQKLLKLKELPKSDDAADALGIAICGALKQRELNKNA